MKVGVVMGGISSERDVSLMTGQEMIAHLDQTKYDVIPVQIDKKEDLIAKAKGLDLALIALHGKFGEDGTIQGTLETLGVPYTGSGVLSSSLCMDKNMSKKIMRFEGIPTPDWVCFSREDEVPNAELEKLGYPLVVKPNSGGSSVGVKIVKDQDALLSAIKEVFQWDSEVLIEQYVKGDEITCAVLDGKLLPVLSIRHAGEFFDYQSKYNDARTIEEPIELPEALHEKVAKATLDCYRALKCSVYARIDMMVKDGVPYVMEVNTLPGMTKNSLLPKSARAAGISYSELLDLIIQISLRVRKSEGM